MKRASTRKPCTRIATTCVPSPAPRFALGKLTLCTLQQIDDATRTAIARVSNIIRVLAAHFTPLSDTVLLEAYEWAVEQECDVKDLLQDEVGAALVAAISAQQ